MVYSYEIDGLPVQTGDIICTSDGNDHLLPGAVWRVFGALVPGPVDHMALYCGPGGLCVESGPAGVTAYEVEGNTWDAQRMASRRALLTDTLYGVAYPLAGRAMEADLEATIRVDVAAYCLEQAAAGRHYNFNFLDSQTEKAFYCTQLVYQAYLRSGIDLNVGQRLLGLPGTDRLILPQEIWDACAHRRVGRADLEYPVGEAASAVDRTSG